MELPDSNPKPRSEKQREASRLNGMKSRGPVKRAKPEISAYPSGTFDSERDDWSGRFNSSRNSTRHGLLAKSVVLENESPARFLDLVRATENRFDPADELEQALVETLAVARWRQSRIWEMERAGFHLEMRGPVAGAPGSAPDAATQAWIAFRSLGGSSNPLDIINRFESRCDRQIDRAIERLNKLRKLRQAPEIEYCEIDETNLTID